MRNFKRQIPNAKQLQNQKAETGLEFYLVFGVWPLEFYPRNLLPP